MISEMALQQVESQYFPFQLEWVGGRSTFIHSQFSARNACICLEDMKETEVVLPVALEKTKNWVAFRSANKAMEKVIDLEDIVQIHYFPTDPNYAVFEINSHDGHARFEVVRTPRNESLKNLQDFVFTRNFANPSAPVLLKENNEFSRSAFDGYEAPEPPQPATYGDSSLSLQTPKGYEEVAMEIVDETVNKCAILPSRSSDTPKAENSVEEVVRIRETPSTTSVSSDTHINTRNPEEISAALVNVTKDVDIDENTLGNGNSNQQPPKHQQKHAKAKAPKEGEFARLVTLTDLITEESIDIQNYYDDGKCYVISKIGPKPSNRKSHKSHSSGYRQNKSQKRYMTPSLHIRMETPDESVYADFIHPENAECAKGGQDGPKHTGGLYHLSRKSKVLQQNPIKVHPYDESHYSLVYLKNKGNDSSYPDSLSC